MKDTRLSWALRRCSVLALIVGAITCVGLVKAYRPQKSNPEKSTDYNSKGEVVNVETTYDNDHRPIERKEFDRTTGKLQKRVTYKYLKGFKEPDTSETRYAPDGTTVTGTTNVDHDKDGQPTNTTTTEYDAAGKEISGSKRERDATGKERCYNWDSTKQAYEEVKCFRPWVSGVGMNDSAGSKKQDGQVVANGELQTVVFDTAAGTLRINLPADMMAGDTISGTVFVEPKGTNDAEKNQNTLVLSAMVIDLDGTQIPVRQPLFTWVPPNLPPLSPLYRLRLIELPPVGTSQRKYEYHDVFITRYALPKDTVTSGGNIAEPRETQIPTLGQAGRPITISGNFDGNSSNTTVNVGGQPVTLLAESPRKAIFQAPANVTGPMEIRVKEGTTETKGMFRNVGVSLTAPKTSLMKGESTELHVEVSGLQGITQPVPLHLTNEGVITMSGGNSQTMSIRPSDVKANGTYTTTRTITGVQTGGWAATATVVSFNTCLQDDGDPLRILLFNVYTGDFVFCQGRGESTGTKPLAISTFPLGNDFRGGVSISAGDGIDSPQKPGSISIGPGSSVTRTGAIMAADFLFTYAQIHLELNEYSHMGSANVQIRNPKERFIITDRDTRNNICTCQ